MAQEGDEFSQHGLVVEKISSEYQCHRWFLMHGERLGARSESGLGSLVMPNELAPPLKIH